MGRQDEWKDAVGKERTKGVRVHRGVLTRAGEFLPFFLLALFFVVVDFAFLLSSSSKKKKSTTTWHVTRKEQNPLGRGDIFFPESGVWLAQKREFFLFFSIFFSRSTQRDLYTKKESLTSFLLKTKNTYAIRNTRFSRQAKYSFGSVSRRPDMNVGEAMAASGNVSFRFTLRF